MVFEIEKFKNPSKDHNVLYTWVWNSHVTTEKIDSRLNDYNQAGIKGLYVLALPKNFRPGYMETDLNPEYLSDEFFDLLEYAFKKAKGYGIELWLYDEGGWPSGGACGRTGAENSDAYETTLTKCEIVLKKGETFTLKKPSIAVFDGIKRLKDSFTAFRDMTVTVYEATKATDKNPNRVDGTNKAVIDTFLNNTYDKYYDRFGYMFGTDLKAIFTDEPALLKNTLPKNIFEIFKDKYGYDLIDFLPFLLDGDLEMDYEQSKARIDYARLLGELFCENYCRNISHWCNEHNIKMAGHLDIDHTPHSTDNHAYFSHLNCLTQFAIPGIDVIWEQIRYPYDGRKPVEEGYSFFPRIASSASHQNGSNLALSESFAVFGDGLTPNEIRYILNYQAVRGINIFNFMLASIDAENQNALVERPVFSPEKPGFYHLKHINEYYARLCYLLKVGKPFTFTALYNPCADYWAGNSHRDNAANAFASLGEKLEKSHIDFDIIDDYAINSAIVTEKGLKIGDMLYQKVYVPKCEFMPADVNEKIALFISTETSNTLNLCSNENLRLMTRKLKNGTLYFVFNQSADAICDTLNLPTDILYKIDLQTAKVYKTNNTEVSLECGEIAVFLVCDHEIASDKNNFKIIAKIDNFKPILAQRSFLTPEGIKKKKCEYKDLLPKYSGEITFTSNLVLPQPPKKSDLFKITLTNTSVTAAVAVNGKQIATFGMTPMTAVVKGECFEKENHIEITAANTFANEIVANHTIIDSYPKSKMGSYDAKSILFEQRCNPIRLGTLIVEKCDK